MAKSSKVSRRNFLVSALTTSSGLVLGNFLSSNSLNVKFCYMADLNELNSRLLLFASKLKLLLKEGLILSLV